MKCTNFGFAFPAESLGVKSSEPSMLIYNAFTNSLATIEQSKYNSYELFRRDGMPINDEKLIEDLRLGGFLIDDDFDEMKELQLRMLQSRYDNTSFGLTIAPTSDCNFRCVYCYEKDKLRPSYMSKEVMDAVVALVESKAPHISSFSVTWYGGEPLLAMDVIEKLSKRFKRICKKNRIHYSAGIITNGSLLTREIVEKLSSYDVNFYQITIDGTRETHNQRRVSKCGEGTYDCILENIEACIDLLPRVSLRINVDKENIAAADQIIEVLHERGLQEKVHPYLGKITNDNDDPALDKICFTTQEFAGSALAFTQKIEKNEWKRVYPSPKGAFCGADSVGSFVVDSDGMLYKCWNDIGNKQMAVGNIASGKREGFKVYTDYVLYNPCDDPVCSKCKVLPLCMGGCPHRRLEQRKGSGCTQYKYVLQQYLTYAAREIIHEREREQSCNKNSLEEEA